jgi:hypothetical protein
MMAIYNRYVKWVRCGGGHTVMCLSPADVDDEEEGEGEAAIEWNSEQKETTLLSSSPRLSARQEEKLSESKAGMYEYSMVAL